MQDRMTLKPELTEVPQYMEVSQQYFAGDDTESGQRTWRIYNPDGTYVDSTEKAVTYCLNGSRGSFTPISKEVFDAHVAERLRKKRVFVSSPSVPMDITVSAGWTWEDGPQDADIVVDAFSEQNNYLPYLLKHTEIEQEVHTCKCGNTTKWKLVDGWDMMSGPLAYLRREGCANLEGVSRDFYPMVAGLCLACGRYTQIRSLTQFAEDEGWWDWLQENYVAPEPDYDF